LVPHDCPGQPPAGRVADDSGTLLAGTQDAFAVGAEGGLEHRPRMSHLRAYLLARGGVPQARLSVAAAAPGACRGEQAFAVGAERDRVDDERILVGQRDDRFTRLQVPDMDLSPVR